KLLTPNLLKNVQTQGKILLDEVKALVANHPLVKEVRGAGFMVGVELNVPGADFVQDCRDKGLLINCTQGNILRFLPPMALSKPERQAAMKVLKAVFEAHHK